MQLGDFFKNALVLIPNPSLRNQINSDLRKAGIQISKSTGIGRAVFDELVQREFPCDVIFMDCKLSDIEGKSFLEALRKDPSFNHVHVFAFYDQDQPSFANDMLSLGVSGLMPKSIKGDFFVKEILSRMGKFIIFSKNFSAFHIDTVASYFESQKQYQTAMKYYEETLGIIETAQSYFDAARMASFSSDEVLSKKLFEKSFALDQRYLPLIKKHLLQVKTKTNTSQNLAKIPKQAIDIFTTPFEKISKGFYGSTFLKKVLIVGQSHQERVRIKSILTEHEIKNCQMVSSGQEALSLIKDQSFDLVIINILISDMNGLQLVEAIRTHFPQKQILLMLLLEESLKEHTVSAIQMGIDGYLEKPYTTKSLAGALHKMMLQEHILCESSENKSLLKQAFFLQELENLDLAKSKALLAIEQNTSDPMACLYFAMILHKNSELKEASKWYQMVPTLNPSLAILSKSIYQIAGKFKLEKEKKAKKEEEFLKSKEEETVIFEISEDHEQNQSDFVIEDENEFQSEKILEVTDKNKTFEDNIFLEPNNENSEVFSSDEVKSNFLIDAQDAKSNDQGSLSEEPVDANMPKIIPIQLDSFDQKDEPDVFSINKSLTLENLNKNLEIEDSSLVSDSLEKVNENFDQKPLPKKQSIDLNLQTLKENKDEKIKENQLQIELDQSSLPFFEDKPKQNKKESSDNQDFLLQKKSSKHQEEASNEHLSFVSISEDLLATINSHALENTEENKKIDPKDLFHENALQFVDQRLVSTSKDAVIDQFFLGITPASLPQIGHVEQILTDVNPELTLKDGTSVKVVGMQVAEWMPHLKFKSIMADYGREYENEEDPKKATNQTLLKGGLNLINQSRLFQSRIGSYGDDEEKSVQEDDYFKAIGQIFSDKEQLSYLIKNQNNLDKDTKKLIDAAEDKQTDEVYEKLGRNIVYSNLYSDFLNEASNALSYAISHPEEVQTEDALYSMRQIESFEDAIYRLSHQSKSLHDLYTKDKQNFNHQLDYILSQGDLSEEETYKLIQENLKTDHYSLEAFKATFGAMQNKKMAKKYLDKLLSRFLSKQGHDMNALIAFADTLIAMKEYEKGVEILSKVIKKMSSPEIEIYLRKLAMVCYKGKKFDDSIYWSKRLISYIQGDENSFNLIGVCFKKMKKFKDSVKSYEKGIKYNPLSYKLHYNLAIALANVGEEDESQKYLNLSKRLKKDDNSDI